MPAPFADLDVAAVSRAVAQVAEGPTDLADAFFELLEAVELAPLGETPGIRVTREAGLAIRLVRGSRTWLAGRDGIDAEAFDDALRRVARAAPRAPQPPPRVGGGWTGPVEADEVLAFPSLVERAFRGHRAGAMPAMAVRRHRRATLVVGPQLASGVEEERFWSVEARFEGGGWGALLPALGEATATEVARRLARLVKARAAPPPATWRGPTVLGPSAAAVLLHEAVAHALEADTLALGGHPEAAVGVRLGPPSLHVVDDPASAPETVRRATDDEGHPVSRRFLLRAGVVEQPLCDRFWARQSEVLLAGAGRRGNRHQPPGPRSTHLEVLPGELSHEELCGGADGGLYLAEAQRGRLDPVTGAFELAFAAGRRIENGVPGKPVGPSTLRGQVGDLMAAVTGIGRDRHVAGAGWCAKGGSRLPVWATVPALRLEGVEVAP